MKILIVSQYYHPERFKVTDLAEELVKRGHEIDVLTGLPNYPEGKIPEAYLNGKNRRESIHGVNVIRVALVARGEGKVRLALNYVSFAFNATLKSFSLKKEYDLILVYQLSPILMAIPAICLKHRKKIPLILYTLDLWPDSLASLGIRSHSLFYRIVKQVSRWIYRQADAQWVSSASFAEYLRELTQKNTPILHLPQYAESQFDLPVKPPSTEFVCLFAGNIGKAQGLDTILYAAQRLSAYTAIRFEIVGTGSDIERLKQLAQQLDLHNLAFLGSHDLSAMPGFYQNADLFLLTLFDDPVIAKTLPGKVQSYMASGKPIVAAAGGETALVLQESGAGRVGKSGDDLAMSENILHYYHHRDQVEIDGKKGKEYYATHYDRASFFETLIEQCNQTIQGGKKHVSR